VYAKGGIPEYWVLEPERNRLVVFRLPTPEGVYQTEFVLAREETVSPLFAPQIKIALKDLL